MSDTSTKERGPRDDWHRPNHPGKDGRGEVTQGGHATSRFSIDDVITAMKKHEGFFDDKETAIYFRASVVRDLISLQIKREGEKNRAANNSLAKPCSSCFSSDCNGECMGDDLMGA